jgi:hypothetical protein
LNKADTSTTSWGKAESCSTAGWNHSQVQRHSSAKGSVEAGKICERKKKRFRC